MGTILMIVAMIAIFYFMMIRPQNKKQKELKQQREAMRNGSKVVTAGGIHGKIKEIKNNGQLALIEIATGVVIRVDINSVYPLAEAAEGKSRQDKSEKELKAEKEDKEEKKEKALKEEE